MWDRTEMRAEFLWVKLKEAEHLEDLTQMEGLIWLRMGTCVGVL
jgi:hypothetical protein